jgi:adenylate cyclase
MSPGKSRPPRRTSSITEAVFLHETEAAIVVFDLRGFTKLCASLSPLELGMVVARYYRHAERCVDDNGGRVFKIAGDKVLAAWLANETGFPKPAALSAVAQALAEREAWLKVNPELDYVVACAAGPVLAGQIGTSKIKTFDVLGEPVNVAYKLTSFAAARGADHLLATAVPDHPAVEVEGVELGGKRLRLFRLTTATK